MNEWKTPCSKHGVYGNKKGFHLIANHIMTNPLQPPAGKRKLHSLKIDMTPMVDLGFLLITFFIFTTTMAEPKIIKLIMPAHGKPIPVKESRTLTALLDKDKLYIYNGEWKAAQLSNTILQTNYDVAKGVGKFIRQKQKELEAKGDGNGLVFIIKALPSSSYQNLVAALDEVLINDLQYYAVADATKEEKAFAENKH